MLPQKKEPATSACGQPKNFRVDWSTIGEALASIWIGPNFPERQAIGKNTGNELLRQLSTQAYAPNFEKTAPGREQGSRKAAELKTEVCRLDRRGMYSPKARSRECVCHGIVISTVLELMLMEVVSHCLSVQT